MELPITRPSLMSYADQINFNELVGELKSKKFNGFIRVTAGSSEGYILFNDGKESASSFDDYLKKEAIEKIKATTSDSKTLIEVFDLKQSQMKYLMDLNKFCVIDIDSQVDNIIDELKKTEERGEIKEKSSKLPMYDSEPQLESLKKVLDEPKDVLKGLEPADNINEVKEEPKPVLKDLKSENDTSEVREKLMAISQATETKVPETNENEVQEKPLENESVSDETNITENLEQDNIESKKENEFAEPGVEAEVVDRAELMKKYGLKDVGEEEVENILETYKGGSLSDEDIEKIELTLMNKIKKSILGIPKIKGTEVMVFLDNTSELSGTINIITEYESKSLLSRFMGDSKDLENLRRQIINITQMEIKKSFRGYPEIVEDFEINVEIS
ncbi:hypothetical protein [Methanobacterium sp. ACI-7]|uniref:hypothetical protein n=1 Tax=unclassified Methanobacterium TaxID=2627676 RepID=UPI0039C3E4AD